MQDGEINNFEKLSENFKAYVNTRYDLITLKVTQKIAEIGSQGLSILIIVLFLSMFLLFFNIAAAFFISSLLKVNYAGFFIVAAFYLFISVLLLIFRKKWMLVPLRNLITKALLKDV